MASRKSEASRLHEILGILKTEHADVRPGLDHRNPWELLVATVLSAQCTDVRVNQVTPTLFARYPTTRALADARPDDVEAAIRSIGLFRNKARSLIAMARLVTEAHGGRVPQDRPSLEALPGVGRKTASVVLGQGFGTPAFPVDTHVARVCHRLGFSTSRDPRRVEERVTALFEPSCWVLAHLLLIRHGRRTCTARGPKCPGCSVRRLCPWPGKG
jgi:endonuclease-3